ncbi:hypothetical protein A7311_01125 [Paenibacillus polymyxa]|uniref:hypothetical protein n=1 Tax=Paenibacillus polymyxa TaxID=1406 RepID=UPI00083D3941|nr:hypothetical protein [Paenibacillus polymyxa]ODB56958.1 hypothetical protein A7311_01125 [Paenibacillus polymyxa]
MVDDATKLGDLLKLPDLEEETKQLINAKLRELIGEVKPPVPLTPAQQQEVQSLMSEYLYGSPKEEGE